MLIYLYGPDSYRVQKKQREIIAAYLKKNPDGIVDYFFLDHEGDFPRLKTFCAEQSLFSKTKIGVVYRLDEEIKGLIPFLKEQLESKGAALIIRADKKLPKAFDFLLKKPAGAQEFELLEGVPLLAFIKKEAGRLDLGGSPQTIQSLIESYGSDLWAVISELEKISLGGKPDLPGAKAEFFPLVRELAYGRSSLSGLPILSQLLEREGPAAVFNVLATLVSGGQKIKMADYDVAIKSGKLEYPEALLDFILS